MNRILALIILNPCSNFLGFPKKQRKLTCYGAARGRIVSHGSFVIVAPFFYGHNFSQLQIGQLETCGR